jgi:ABC-type multidrug transport system fused ATPase/permease subunit
MRPQQIRQLLRILSPAQRGRLGWLCVILSVMAVFEVVGVASVMPFIGIVANPSLLETQPILRALREQTPVEGTAGFLLVMGSAVLLLIALSNALSAFGTWFMLAYTWDENHLIAERLLTRYLHQPYLEMLGKNTAELGKNMLAEVGQLVTGVLMRVAQLFARIIVLALVLALLLAYDPMMALAVGGGLGVVYALIFLVLRPYLNRIGAEQVAANTARYQTAMEALGAFREISLRGLQDFFVDRFSAPSRRYSHLMAVSQSLSLLPRFFLETVAFGAVMIIVMYQIWRGSDLTAALPAITLYTLAAYRILPALQAMFTSATLIRFNAPLLDVIEHGLAKGPGRATRSVGPGPVFEREIRLDQVSFAYPDGRLVVKEVDLRIGKNFCIGLVGGTGSGKSTLVDLLVGLLQPCAGTLRVDGVEIVGDMLPAWQRRVGYVPQQIVLIDASIRRNIAFGVPEDQVDQAAVEQAARLAGIHETIVGIPEGYDSPVGEKGGRLSGGQRQRIGIARALYANPEILILDEATSALDNLTEEAVMDAIRRLAGSKTIIIIAHRLNAVRACDEILVMEDGRIAERGTHADLMSRQGRFAALSAV